MDSNTVNSILITELINDEWIPRGIGILDLKFAARKVRAAQNESTTTNGQTTMDHLPNELLFLILGNLDVQELIHLQLVNWRWLSVIESLCHRIQSLSIYESDNQGNYYSVDSLWLKVDTFTRLQLRSNSCHQVAREHYSKNVPNSSFIDLMWRLFPNLTRLTVDVWHHFGPLNGATLLALLHRYRTQLSTLSLDMDVGKSQSGTLCERINSMTQLKRLSLGFFVREIVPARDLVPTIARLDRFSFDSSLDGKIITALQFLGERCTHLRFKCHVDLPLMIQMFQINAPMLSRLTHLHLAYFKHPDALDLLCEHAVSLQVLHIKFNFITKVPAASFVRLSKLVHLNQLRLAFVVIDLDKFDETGHVQFPSMRTLECSMPLLGSEPCDTKFCDIFSTMFPYIQQLHIECHSKFVIEPRLNMFAHLRKHSIESFFN